ncbi:hypothetical protein A2U01_0070335, partial [Trifolium medium]|nr:hypothetical protein [Trifolium medium]
VGMTLGNGYLGSCIMVDGPIGYPEAGDPADRGEALISS